MHGCSNDWISMLPLGADNRSEVLKWSAYDGHWDGAVVHMNLEVIHGNASNEEKIKIMIQVPTCVMGRVMWTKMLEVCDWRESVIG